jgi:hypothetical protein
MPVARCSCFDGRCPRVSDAHAHSSCSDARGPISPWRDARVPKADARDHPMPEVRGLMPVARCPWSDAQALGCPSSNAHARGPTETSDIG